MESNLLDDQAQDKQEVLTKSSNYKKKLLTTITILIVILSIIVFGLKYYKQSNLQEKQKKDTSVKIITAAPTLSDQDIYQKAAHRIEKYKPIFPDLSKYKDIINDGKIYYIKLGELYVLDTTSMISKQILIEGKPVLRSINISHSGQYLFLDGSANDPVSNMEDSNRSIIIYDIKSNKIIATTKYIGANTRVESGDVSPNDKYIIVTTSTAPGDAGKTLVSVPDGNIIKKFTARNTIWNKSSQKFALSKSDLYFPLTDPSIGMHSIYIEDISTGNIIEKRLLVATSQIDYSPISWNYENSLVVGYTTYSLPLPSASLNSQQEKDKYYNILNHPVVKYISVDPDTGEQTPINPPNLDYYSISPAGKWKLTRQKSGDSYVYYIIQIDGNIKILFDAENAVWGS